MPLARRLTIALVGAACAAAPGARAVRAQPPAAPAAQPADSLWPVRTREHVDLWLHGLALLMADTTRPPLYRRAYADSMRARRTRDRVLTAFDAQQDKLRGRLTASPRLGLGAQFVPFAFGSWSELKRAVDGLAMTGGDPRRAADPTLAEAIAFLAASFPTAADREWARVFANALQEELDRFYHAYWLAEQRDRTPTLAAVESAWRSARPRLQRFLNNTQQRAGELVLSLPLGGEGRTTSAGSRRNLVAVGFPDSPAAAGEAVAAFAHEVVGTVASTAVSDNVTPAEQRSGVADRYVAAAQVRGGYLLLEKTAPELAAGYAQYYLRLAGATLTGDPAAALATAFPLPQAIVDAVRRQIESTLEGI
jgi:hypothetical protein